MDADHLLAGLAGRSPADPAAVRRLAEQAGIELPPEYLGFLASSDGGEGDVGVRWLEIWPIERVLDQLEREPHYEGVVLFAGDGANTIYGFDRFRDGHVVEGDWIGLTRDEAIDHGSFVQFLQALTGGRP